MSIEELKQKMSALRDNDDEELRHVELDNLLLQYINDKEITEIFESMGFPARLSRQPRISQLPQIVHCPTYLRNP